MKLNLNAEAIAGLAGAHAPMSCADTTPESWALPCQPGLLLCFLCNPDILFGLGIKPLPEWDEAHVPRHEWLQRLRHPASAISQFRTEFSENVGRWKVFCTSNTTHLTPSCVWWVSSMQHNVRSVAVRVQFSMCTCSFLGSTPGCLGLRSRTSSRRDCSRHSRLCTSCTVVSRETWQMNMSAAEMPCRLLITSRANEKAAGLLKEHF